MRSARALRDRYRAAWAPLPLGYVLVDQGNDDRARIVWGQSVQSWRDLGNMSYLGSFLEAFGYQATHRGSVMRALRLAGAAAALRRTQTAIVMPEARFWLDRWLPSARKAVTEAEFIAAWRKGESMSLDEAIAYALSNADDANADHRASHKSRDSELTPREQEVVSLIVKGSSDREIADSLVISEHTAHSHVRNILRKLGLQRRVQIAAWALQSRRRQGVYQAQSREIPDPDHQD